MDYFSVNVRLGVSVFSFGLDTWRLDVRGAVTNSNAKEQKSGIEKILPIGQVDEAEKALLAAAVKELGPSITKVSFTCANNQDHG